MDRTASGLSGADGTLRVMSFNIRNRNPFDFGNGWGFRRTALVQTIRAFEPDVLGTQECRASQANELKGYLPEYTFVGAGRGNGKTRGEMCGIFFRADKYSKMDEGHFWLSDTPDRKGSKDWGMFPRMVTWVKLLPTGSREAFYFFNTHFDLNERSRALSATLLRKRIDQIAGASPVILTGDFNTGEGSRAYNLLVGNGSGKTGTLMDTYRLADPVRDTPEGTRGGFRGHTGGDRIDWILTSPQFTTLDADIHRARVNGRLPSDHFPVTAVLRLPNALLAAKPGDVRTLTQ